MNKSLYLTISFISAVIEILCSGFAIQLAIQNNDTLFETKECSLVYSVLVVQFLIWVIMFVWNMAVWLYTFLNQYFDIKFVESMRSLVSFNLLNLVSFILSCVCLFDRARCLDWDSRSFFICEFVIHLLAMIVSIVYLPFYCCWKEVKVESYMRV